MAHSEASYVQLPPDSTGKKSGASGRLIIDYSGESSPKLFVIGQTITGQTSGATGKIVGINNNGFASGEGQLFFEVSTLSGAFQTSEDLQIAAVTYGVVKSTSNLSQIYYQKQAIIDRDSPDHSLLITSRGEACVAYTDGSPSITSFGSLVVDNPEVVRQYVHAYSDLSEEFYVQTSGVANTTYLSDERAVTLDTNSTASGVFVNKTSHINHPYQPGSILECIQSIVVGDTGKAGVRRRWGMFDENDGVFWEVDDTILYTVIRSNTTGTPIDTRVAQSAFNKDMLDGTNDMTIDISKANIYWIDIQWLGVGVVNFGIFGEDGNKLKAHTFENANANTSAYMGKASLPIRYECQNKTTAASSSELKTICSIVKNFGKIKRHLHPFSVNNSSAKSVVQSDGEKPLISTRAATTFNSLSNKGITHLGEITVSNVGTGVSLLRVRRGSDITGSLFSSADSGSSTEYDEAGTELATSGVQIWSCPIRAGETKTHNFFDSVTNRDDCLNMIVQGDGTTSPIVSITAESLDANSSGNLISTIEWKEVRL